MEPAFGDDRLPPRFWAKVEVDERGCWLWTGCRNPVGGYARFNYPTRKDSAYGHRVAYETLVSPIPDGLHVDHLCRVRHCVNPAHMEPVTCRENLRRGVSPSALHAIKTHCPAGHPLSGENLYEWTNRKGVTMRQCLTCRRAHGRTTRRRAA